MSVKPLRAIDRERNDAKVQPNLSTQIEKLKLFLAIHERSTMLLRERPFNFKGGGGYGFWGEKKFLSANLIEKKILSLKWAETNILLAL